MAELEEHNLPALRMPPSSIDSVIDLDQTSGDERHKVERKPGKRQQMRSSLLTVFHLLIDGKEVVASPALFQELVRLAKDAGADKIVGQLERCPETDKLHLQVAIKWKNQKDFSFVSKLFHPAHIESGRKWENMVDYCSKEETRVDGPWASGMTLKLTFKMEQRLDIPKDGFEWQKQWFIKLTQKCTKEDDRSVHWICDTDGNAGKSTLVWEVVRHWEEQGELALSVGGKAADIKSAIAKAVHEDGKHPVVVLMDVPRTSMGFLSYEAIESIKNRLFFSGKYESGMVAIKPVHVVVFSNTEPDYAKLSADRWNVHHVKRPGVKMCVKSVPHDILPPPNADGVAAENLWSDAE